MARGGRIVGLIIDHALRPEVRLRNGSNRVPARTPWVRGRILAGPRPSRAPACSKQRARRAIGCCARPVVGAAFSICWSRTMAMIRPRPWLCAPLGKPGPDGLAGMSAAVELRRCGCCGRCSGFPGRASPRRCSPWRAVRSTILPTPIRASSGQGCAPAIDRLRRPPIATVRPRAKARCRRGRGLGYLADRRCRHRPVGLCPFGTGRAGEAVESGRPGDRRQGSPAATGPAGPGGRPSLRCRGAGKVGRCLRFHSFRM